MSGDSDDIDSNTVEMNGVDVDHETDGSHESDSADDVDIGNNNSDHQIDGNDAFEFDEQKACIGLAKFFCYAGLPPQTTDEYHFRALLNTLNPQFQGSVADVARYCLETYEEVKAKIKHVLSTLDGQMSLSIDILRYEKRYCYVKEYLCLSAHFIDSSNWKMKKWILRFRKDDWKELPHELLLNAVKEWEIEGKVSAITMLNDNYFDETFELVKDHVQGNSELKLNGRMYRVYCAADMVSRMVQGAYESISQTIDIVSELYPWKSPPLWYLTSSKLKGALELEAMGEYSSEFVLGNYKVPSPDEWEKVRSLCELVESIYKVTQVLFDVNLGNYKVPSPTANIYLYHLREVRAILLQKSTSSDIFIQGVAEKMLKKFDKYWKEMYLVLAVAMVMDPRFKMKYLEFSSSEFDDSDGIPGHATVLEAIRNLFNDYVTQFPEKDFISNDSTSSESAFGSEEGGEEEPCREEPRNLDDVYKLLPDYFQFVESSSRPPKSELDWYLEEPVLPWSHDFSVLSWWRSASAKYPVLSKMARNLLGIPLSVTTSYDAFYTEPREADERIIGSGPKMMNALMCTKSWYPWP